MSDNNLIPVKEQDFLDEDPPLRGQNFACLSFISPEDVIKQKNIYFFEKFIQSFSSDLTEFFKQLAEKYKDDTDTLKTIQDRYSYLFDTNNINEEYNFFISSNSNLEKEYFELNQFQTSIRGIKVRGVFDTLREAEIRSQVLKRIDGKFDVFVAQVGSWCPWSPNPDDIANQEYSETHLNTLMKNYKENQDKKDYFYEERKKELQFNKVKDQLEKKDPFEEKNEIIPKLDDAPIDLPADITPSVEEATLPTDTIPEIEDERTSRQSEFGHS
jgi:hypothetical protein